MSLSALFLCAAMMLAAPVPAYASPDIMVDIHEEPIGISETHLFLLRTSKDNLGYYEALRVEMFLLIRDFASGEETHVVIDKFVRSSDYTDDGEFTGYSIKRDAGVVPVDPYTFVRERGALPWPAVANPAPFEFPPRVGIKEGVVEVQFGSNPPITLSREKLEERLAHVQQFMVVNVADHPRSSSMTTLQYFAQRQVSPDHCHSGEVLEYWLHGKGKHPHMVQVHCSFFDRDGETTSVVVELPPIAE